MSPRSDEDPIAGDPWLRRVAQAIAVAFVTGDPDPAAMAGRASEAIGDERGDWLPALAAQMAEWWPSIEPSTSGGDVGRLAEMLTTLILRSDTFAYVARTWHEPILSDDERHQVAELLDDVDPALAETLWEDAETEPIPPWRDDAVRSSPTEPGPSAWTRRAHVDPLPPDIDEVVDAPSRRRDPAPARPRFRGVINWPVPAFEDRRDLAEWFGLHPQHLAWYADARSMERDAPAEPLRHYTYRWLPKRTGGARLLESPKPVLRFFQRRILHEIVDLIPAHPAAHGFRPGRSVHSFAAPHAGRSVVIRLDLASFFASVSAGRVFGILRTAGYPAPVAHALTAMVTNTVPHAVRGTAPRPPAGEVEAHRRALNHLAHPHLPQGAPTSPALANLAAFGLDRRVAGLARAFDATYTRYADDLAFSGGPRLRRHAPRFLSLVTRIVTDEGFDVNRTKTRVMGADECQAIAGMVVNGHAQVRRADYDQLRAVLHDAATNGPAAANRADHPEFRAHLLGRIGWVSTGNEARGTKLRTMLDTIDW